MRRRHPSPMELGAYFDGELIEGVQQHVAHCRRCREAVDELRGVRSAVRGELDLTDGSARRRSRWTVALIPVAAAVALLVAVANPPGGLPVTRVENADESAAAPAAQTTNPVGLNEAERIEATPTEVRADRALAASVGQRVNPSAEPAATPSTAAPAAEGSGPAPAADSTPPGPVSGRSSAAAPSGSSSGPKAAAPPSGPLRLGVSVPTRGASAGEGDEVVRSVRAVAQQANDAGGVAGRRVEVVIVPTDDDSARAAALTRIDALVGGFAVDGPSGIPWIMPADTVPDGPDVAASEVAAEQAGAALGADLAARGFSGRTAGAIVASGPDAGLATGLARSVPVQRVEASSDTSCDQEISALRRRDVVALAFAGPPQMARHCAAAAARIGWRPVGGLLVAPSAVYSHLERDLVAQGARSAIGLPPPSGDDAGPSRFHQSAPGCESYRSLVSFAAAELALDAARASGGALTAAAVRDRHWHSDLYDIDGGRHTAPRVVAIRFGRWSDARTPSKPPPRRGVDGPGGLGDLLPWASREA